MNRIAKRSIRLLESARVESPRYPALSGVPCRRLSARLARDPSTRAIATRRGSRAAT